MSTKFANRFVVLLFLAGVLLVACQTAPAATPTPEPTATPSGPDPTTLAQQVLEALNDGDATTAASYLSDDAMFTLGIRIHRHLHEEPVVSKDSILAYWQSDSWKNVTVIGKNFGEEDGQVIFDCKIYAGTVLVGAGSVMSNDACMIVVTDGQVVFVGDQATGLLYFKP